VRPFYKLNEAPGIPEEMLPVCAGISQQPGLYDFWRLVEIQREIVAKMGAGVVTRMQPDPEIRSD
jgi:acyl-CoA dehydrogenase